MSNLLLWINKATHREYDNHSHKKKTFPRFQTGNTTYDICIPPLPTHFSPVNGNWACAKCPLRSQNPTSLPLPTPYTPPNEELWESRE